MKKKFIALALGCLSLLVTNNVSAQEIYYTNSNGVSLTEEEYNFLENMFFEGYTSFMTQENYNEFIEYDMLHSDFDKVSMDIYDDPLTRSTVIGDANRQLSIAKACHTDGTCTISVAMKWYNSPTVRSYDVMGCYLYNVSRVTTPVTSIYTASTGASSSSNNLKYGTNGFGNSTKLPAVGYNITISQLVHVTTGGTVYASYQHAMSNITLANSQNYTFSRTGFGGVFNFAGVARTTYDRMNGVSITV